MERKQLVALVAAILVPHAKGDLDKAVKDAQELVNLVETGKHTPTWDGSVRSV